MYHGSGGGVGLDQWSSWVSQWRLVDFWVDVCCVYGFVGSSDGGFNGEFFWLGLMVAQMVGFWLGLN